MGDLGGNVPDEDLLFTRRCFAVRIKPWKALMGGAECVECDVECFLTDAIVISENDRTREAESYCRISVCS
jgi:hypothetical protein